MTESARVLLDITVDGTDAMGELGARLAAVLRAGDLVVLTGPLGAGKTTLTRGLGAALGARGQVSSPTFVLARTHPTTAGPDLVHVDAYRLSDPVELDDLDLYWDAAIVVVEWGRGMVEGISDSVLDVEITRATGADDAADDDRDPDDVPDEPRRVVVTATGPRWEGVAL
ncbi:tRNA (adenosine(37)-N6)-threonylcarbamoyltransferase complex ATPase subunit type 1 TsaE [Curtobacterium flaccumfaciens pv. flaccumfaciens]|uniref:tRNA (adenosine(37)-N6)-threonylcarbamoyltransferase complex ATPase subunit type 1 TsaE n=1 Tax=Curtobacterium flaccumfaciens TaxID=2035 RepID=UPI00217D0C19|nr:tRNA (adenosine(37)-N6)-threonylcarbamoyltransferase complex ATPase subunit type 1 TsaE [Curtobacterium flaccumfaciens]MCS6548788.1 tRNA (adenosine(37)-N6)-threonylcarbamoyltransferase complex ATPase subunit type 1 TsaE [Curtobacterium flaccumfaciens pv. flaccumfaciens]